MANRITTWTSNQTLTEAALNGEFNNLFSGTIDRTGGRWGTNNDIPFTLGSSQEAQIEWNTDQSQNELQIGVSGSNVVHIVEKADMGVNWAFGNSTNPTLFISSNDATDIQSYIAMTHDVNVARITTGTGKKIGWYLADVSTTVPAMMLGAGPTVYLAPSAHTETNSKMSIGLNIDQGASDNEILAFRSSDVAHGMTLLAETDTYAAFKKCIAATGGLGIQGYSEDEIAIQLDGYPTNVCTDKNYLAQGAFNFNVAQRNGVSAGVTGADANLFCVKSNGSTRFIFDTEGSFHADVESTTYDEYDDIALIKDMEAEMLRDRDPIQAEFIGAAKYNRKLFEDLNLVHFDDNNPGHAMINLTRIPMLCFGALRQLDARLKAIEGGI
jgi:hypothetical protein